MLPNARAASDSTRIVHSLADMFRARMFAIACGYEGADDLDFLRSEVQARPRTVARHRPNGVCGAGAARRIRQYDQDINRAISPVASDEGFRDPPNSIAQNVVG